MNPLKKSYLTVSRDGTGDYNTIQSAIDSISDHNEQEVIIYIYKGIYREKLVINKPHITLAGQDRVSTKVVYGDYADMIMENGERRGTFRSQTIFIDADYCTIRNLTIENDAGCGTQKGPAIAVYADGDRLLFDQCDILGSQDTLFTAPLPPVPLVPDGFAGAKADSPRVNGRQHYKHCLISGDVDFIFGSATAFFEACTIYSKNNSRIGSKGYITAASTAKGQEYGYVFYQCKFESNCPPQSVYLGRPWRNFAKTVLISCYLGEHIKTAGWHDWDKPDARANCFYAEYESTGPGASKERADFAGFISNNSNYTREKVLGCQSQGRRS